MKILSTIFLFLTTFQVFSQEKKLNLEEITIGELLLLPYRQIHGVEFDKSKIENLNPEDLSAILQLIPGVSVKNYGGLGGLKTISARGINGQHSGLLIDGFAISNSQTGQIDLGSIPINNIEKIDFSYANSVKNLDAVSSFFNANNLRIETFSNTFPKDTLQIRTDLKIGSFEQKDYFLGAKIKIKKSYFCLTGKYRSFSGNYPISFLNYKQLTNLNRINNDLSEFNTALSFGSKIKNKGEFKAHFIFGGFDKGLPGPVILYNQYSIQRLQNTNLTLNISYNHYFKNSNLRIYSSTRYDDLKYVDSSFLNTQGYQQSDYFNTSFSNGFLFEKNLGNGFQNSFGYENSYSILNSSTDFTSEILRYHNKLFNSISLKRKTFLYTLVLGAQNLTNQENATNNRESFIGFNPAFKIHATRRIGVLGEIYFSTNRTTRFPTFNELYYNGIGNVNLLPEHANQISLGTNYLLNIKNNVFGFLPTIYFNLVENKIVAIPTKNLFIWSIQNIGKVQIFGADLQFSHHRNFNDTWIFTNTVNYSYQEIRDFSSPHSNTYKSQIAYSPKHILNYNFLAGYKKTGINLNANYNGLSYSLNENIKSNEITSFYVFDATFFYTQKIQKSKLRISFSIKNCLNSSYFYIRNYFMPGRNYLISLNYAFN